nr:alpha/beta fold hydrolase [uncultured Duganella sp.]
MHNVQRSLLSLLCGALLAPAAQAAAATLPPVSSFFQTPQIDHVTLSPGGGHVAMTVVLPSGEQALVIRDTARPTDVKVVAQADLIKAGFADLHWISDQRIGYTVKNLYRGVRSNLDEFAVDRDGSNSKHLISGNLSYQQETPIGTLMAAKRVLTSDYAYHSVIDDGSDEILVEKYTWNQTDRGPASSRMHLLNSRTGSIRQAFEGTQPERSLYWLTDNQGQPRVVQTEIGGRCITSYRKPDNSGWVELDSGSCFQDKRFTPLFFDGANALFVRTAHQGHGALFRYDLKTMQLAKEPLVETAGFDFVGTPVIDYPSRRVVGLHINTDAGGSVWFNAALKAEQAKIDALLPGAINTIHCAQRCLASPVLLVQSDTDRQPTQYALYTRASGQLIGLGSIHPEIQPAQMGARSFHRYAARDGRQIPVYVTLPAGKASAPRPAVVLVHGGPNMRGSSWEWDAEAAFLASRGYVVIQPEFRGSTGFGFEHFEAGWKQWGGTMQDDLADAALWAIKQGWADPKRIGIMGASYGGYATLMGLIKHPEIFRTGVEWAGITDIRLMFSSHDSDMSEENLGYGMRTVVGDPEQDRAAFDRASPLLRAAELKQPLLMAHGNDDRRVPVVHADRFRTAVQAHNQQVTSLQYENEGHGWRNEKTRLDFWSKVEAFLDQNLR